MFFILYHRKVHLNSFKQDRNSFHEKKKVLAENKMKKLSGLLTLFLIMFSGSQVMQVVTYSLSKNK